MIKKIHRIITSNKYGDFGNKSNNHKYHKNWELNGKNKHSSKKENKKNKWTKKWNRKEIKNIEDIIKEING